MNIGCLKIIYFGLAQSILKYGIIAWGGASKSVMNKLKITQKLILKIIFNKPFRFSTDSLFAESNIFDLNKLYLFAIGQYIYLSRHKNYLQFSEHLYFTRSKEKNNCKLTKHYKTISARQLNVIAPKLYNEFPVIIKSAIFQSNKIIFIKKFKKWLTDTSLSNITHLLNLN